MLSATLRTSPGVALRGVGGRTVSRARKNPGATFALARNHSLKTAAHARIPQVLCGPVGRSLWPARVAVGAMGPKGGARGKAALQLKLDAVYDAMDSGHWKRALKLIDTLWAKDSSDPELRALRGTALSKSGRGADALATVEPLVAAGVTNAHVRNLTARVLRWEGRQDLLADLYEAGMSGATTADGLRELFHAMSGLGLHVKQQQAAMRLSRLEGSREAQWWAIVSVVLQARAAARALLPGTPESAGLELGAGKGTSPSVEQLAQLALRMATDAKLPRPRTAPEEGVVLGLLRATGQHEEVLAELNRADVTGAGGDVVEARAAVAASLGRAEEARVLWEEALRVRPDDWWLWLQWGACVVPLGGRCTADAYRPEGEMDSMVIAVQHVMGTAPRADSVPLDQEPNEELLARARAFLADLQRSADEAAGGQLVRAPLLAAAELERRLMLRRNAGERDGRALTAAVSAYFDRYGHVTSAAADVAAVVSRDLPWHGREELARTLRDSCPEVAGEGKEAERALRRLVSARAAAHCMGLPRQERPDEAQAAWVEEAQSLAEVFWSTLPLSKGLDRRERGPSDEAVTMAASYLVHAYAASHRGARGAGDAEGAGPDGAPHAPRVELAAAALLVLESALRKRPHNAGMLVAAASCCALLGSLPAMMGHVKALDLKQVQLESLVPHLVTPAAVALGGPSQDTSRVVGTTVVFGDDHAVTHHDSLRLCFEKGSYTKAVEFVDFSQRIAHSFARACAKVELAAAGLRQAVRGGRDAFLAALDTAASAGRPLAERALSGDSGGAPALEPSRLAHLHLNWDLSVRCDWAPPAPGTAEALTGWAERASGGAESWAPGVAVGASGKWWARPGALEEAQRAERAGPSVSGGGGADRGGDSQADAARGFLLESRRALAARACTFVAVRGCVVREGPAQRSEEAAAEALIGELERMGVSDNDAHAKSPLGRLAMGRRLLRWLLCASRAVGRVAAGLEGGPGENDEGSAAEERREAVAREASSALEALSQEVSRVCKAGIVGGPWQGEDCVASKGERGVSALLSGDWVSFVARTASEELAWVRFALESWASELGLPRGKKAKARAKGEAHAGAEALASVHATLRQAIRDCEAAMAAAGAWLRDAAKAVARGGSRAVLRSLSALDGARLWGSEGFDPAGVLDGVAKGVAATLDEAARDLGTLARGLAGI